MGEWREGKSGRRMPVHPTAVRPSATSTMFNVLWYTLIFYAEVSQNFLALTNHDLLLRYVDDASQYTEIDSVDVTQIPRSNYEITSNNGRSYFVVQLSSWAVE